jgi:hypothetical protein
LVVVEGEVEVVAVDRAFHQVGRVGFRNRRHAHDVQLRADGDRMAVSRSHGHVERIEHRERDVATNAHRQPDVDAARGDRSQNRPGKHARFAAECLAQ